MKKNFQSEIEKKNKSIKKKLKTKQIIIQRMSTKF